MDFFKTLPKLKGKLQVVVIVLIFVLVYLLLLNPTQIVGVSCRFAHSRSSLFNQSDNFFVNDTMICYKLPY